MDGRLIPAVFLRVTDLLTPVAIGSCVFLTASYLQALNSLDSLSVLTLHVEKKETVSFGFWMGKRLRLESR